MPSIEPNVSYKVQLLKTTGGKFQVDLASSVSQLFDKQPNNNCMIYDWFVSSDKDGANPITTSSVIGSKLLLDQKRGTFNAPLQTTTTIEIPSFEFYLQIYLFFNSTIKGMLNQQAVKVSVSFGCFEEALSAFWRVKKDS